MASNRVSLGLLMALAAGACAGPPQQARSADASADAAAVAEARKAIVDALNDDDVDAIMAGLTEDHVTLAPGAPILDDVSALRRWHEERVAAVDFDGVVRSEELLMLGDWAVDRWSAAVSARARSDGALVEDRLKGAWIWRRTKEGPWQIAYSVFNSDQSPAATASMTEAARAAIAHEVQAANARLFEAASRVDLDVVFPMIHDDATFLLDGVALTTNEAKDIMRAEWPELRGQRFEMREPTVTVLGPDAAMVMGSGTLARIDTAGTTLGPWPYAYSVLWVRSGDRWQWHDSHQSLGSVE